MPYVRLCRRRDVTTDQIFPEIMPLQLSNLPSNDDRLRSRAVQVSNCRLHCVPIARGGKEEEAALEIIISWHTVFNVSFDPVVLHSNVLE